MNPCQGQKSPGQWAGKSGDLWAFCIAQVRLWLLEADDSGASAVIFAKKQAGLIGAQAGPRRPWSAIRGRAAHRSATIDVRVWLALPDCGIPVARKAGLTGQRPGWADGVAIWTRWADALVHTNMVPYLVYYQGRLSVTKGAGSKHSKRDRADGGCGDPRHRTVPEKMRFHELSTIRFIFDKSTPPRRRPSQTHGAFDLKSEFIMCRVE